MTARVGPALSHGVDLGRSAEVIELCRTGQPVMGWATGLASSLLFYHVINYNLFPLILCSVPASWARRFVWYGTDMAARRGCAGDREG